MEFKLNSSFLNNSLKTDTVSNNHDITLSTSDAKIISKNTKDKTYLVIGCLHAPYHNVNFVNNIIKFKKDNNINNIVIAGDFIDLMGLASYSKGQIIPKTITEEYDSGNRILDQFGDFDDAHFLYGNHEERFNNFLKLSEVSKYGEEFVLSPEKAMKLNERGFTVNNSYKDGHVVLGDLEVIHGVFWNKHVAQKHLDVMKRNVMFVHTHRIQTFSESGITAYNIGWGGNPDAKAFKYRNRIQRANWRNGFAIVNIKNNKSFVTQISANNKGQFYAYNKFYN